VTRHRYAALRDLADALEPELQRSGVAGRLPPFPPRFAQSKLGIPLSSADLASRTEGLERWLVALLELFDKLPSEATQQFDALLAQV
jgi:hypothetical protein